MNRNSNGILVAQNLPRAKKQKKLTKVISKKAIRIQNEHKPVIELMKMSDDETSYAVEYVLTTNAKAVKKLQQAGYALVEQQPKPEADDEWLEHPDYADMEHFKAAYEKSIYFTIGGGDLYTFVGCAEVGEYMIHRYSCKGKSMLVFTLCGKVTGIKYF